MDLSEVEAPSPATASPSTSRPSTAWTSASWSRTSPPASRPASSCARSACATRPSASTAAVRAAARSAARPGCRDFHPVTLRMAREQQLSLNPTKISGACGRLMCCLSYELALYRQSAAQLPPVGAHLQTGQGTCLVIRTELHQQACGCATATGRSTASRSTNCRRVPGRAAAPPPPRRGGGPRGGRRRARGLTPRAAPGFGLRRPSRASRRFRYNHRFAPHPGDTVPRRFYITTAIDYVNGRPAPRPRLREGARRRDRALPPAARGRHLVPDRHGRARPEDRRAPPRRPGKSPRPSWTRCR